LHKGLKASRAFGLKKNSHFDWIIGAGGFAAEDLLFGLHKPCLCALCAPQSSSLFSQYLPAFHVFIELVLDPFIKEFSRWDWMPLR